jgi:transposase
LARVVRIQLEASEEASLKAILRKGADWRERDRAETILLLASGHSVQEVAERQGLCREAVRVRRRKWLKHGQASLPDRPRGGAPSKLTDGQREQLGRWVEAEPLSSRELLTRLARECQVEIGRTTLRMELKKMGYVWKRTRYSLKKNATPGASSRPGPRSTH